VLGIVASRNGRSRNGRVRNGRSRIGRSRNGTSTAIIFLCNTDICKVSDIILLSLKRDYKKYKNLGNNNICRDMLV
jgi:hypothetical protein